MAGSPRNVTHVVPNNELINAAAVQNEVWRLTTLAQQLNNLDAALKLCACRKLINNTMNIPGCNVLCTLSTYRQGIDGKRLACDICGIRKSVRDRSFFTGSHFTLQQIVLLMYCWCHDMPQNLIQHEVDVGDAGNVDEGEEKTEKTIWDKP